MAELSRLEYAKNCVKRKHFMGYNPFRYKSTIISELPSICYCWHYIEGSPSYMFYFSVGITCPCLATSTCIYLFLSTSTYIYLHLPTSTYIYLLLPTSTYIDLHRPTSIYFYLLLPTSTYIHLHLLCLLL